LPEEMRSFWTAFIASALFAYPWMRAMRVMNAVSETYAFAPESHQSKSGTPNVGGVFVLAAILIAAAVWIRGAFTEISIIVFGFGIIGFFDDYLIKRLTGQRGLRWKTKLAAQIVVGLVFCVVRGFNWESAFAAFILVTFANAYNFTDGLDGLAASLMIAALIPFAALQSSALAMAIIGALLPFLVINAPPAKCFMGDVGALPLGALFGWVLLSSPWKTELWPWPPAAIFLIELVLVPVQILAVKTIKRKIFPATPIHHSFELMGWPETRIVAAFVAAQIVLGAISLSLIADWSAKR